MPKMTMATKLATPKGKRVTVAQFLNLAERNEQTCEHGHMGCSAWDNGPCSDEVLTLVENESDVLLVQERE